METDPLNDLLSEKYVPNVSYVSAFLALLVILFMIGISIYDHKLVDRVSLRLQTGLAFYALWLHTGSLWRVPFTYSPSPICTFFGWSMVAITAFDSFINVSIAVNLQLVFIHNVQITKKIEIAYWLVPIIISLLISLPPLALGKLGYSDYAGCYVAAEAGDESYMKIFDFFATQLWRLSRGAVLIGSRKLNTNSESTLKTIKAIRLLGYRILLYPISMLITHSASIVSQIYFDFSDKGSIILDRMTIITYPLIGALNFTAFCCDPTVHDAIKVVLYKIKVIKNNEKKDDINQPAIELNVINSTLDESANPINIDNNHENNETFSNPIESL